MEVSLSLSRISCTLCGSVWDWQAIFEAEPVFLWLLKSKRNKGPSTWNADLFNKGPSDNLYPCSGICFLYMYFKLKKQLSVFLLTQQTRVWVVKLNNPAIDQQKISPIRTNIFSDPHYHSHCLSSLTGNPFFWKF